MVSYKGFKIIEFLRKEQLSVVDIGLLRDISGLKNPQSLASFINSLVKYGVLEKAEKGKYLVREIGNDYLIANLLYKPSYVSLETALNLYGILSQFPYEITSVTSKRKKSKEITGKFYVYYHIKPECFFGFEKKGGALLALPEKALLDMIYFASKGIKRITFDELDLSSIKKDDFMEYSKKFPQTKKFKLLVKEVFL